MSMEIAHTLEMLYNKQKYKLLGRLRFKEPPRLNF